jgi:hypothetical protein
MFRLIALGLTAGLLLCPISAIAVDSDGAEGAIEYRLLATKKTSTMQKELDEAAAQGFRFSAMMGGETLGGAEVVTVLARPAHSDNPELFEYKLLATSKTSTMQKELNAAGEQGYAYVGQSVSKTAFGGDEVLAVLERPAGGSPQRYVYQLLATKRTKSMNAELNEAGKQGFELRGLTVSKTAFGGEELLSILMKAATD